MALLKELVKKGFLEKDKADFLEKEIKASGKKEEEVILEKKIVSEEFLFNLKSEHLKMSLKDIDPKKVALEVLELIPEETAKYYKMVALSKKDDVLEVGMIYPEDMDALEAMKFLSRRGKFDYRLYLITPTTFTKILKQHQTLKKEIKKALEKLEGELKVEKVSRPPGAEIERLVEEAPISKVVSVILRYAVEGKASDIHIEPGQETLRARFRLLGSLHSSFFLPIRLHRAIVSRIKVLSNLRLDETRIPQDGRFSAIINNKNIDFRVSTFPTTLGEKVVLRILDPTVGLRSFKELGVLKKNARIINKAIQKPYGLILSTGPTGCGKTTTLYAILQILNKEGVNIVALEDPVEYFIKGINQSQVKPEIGYTFARGLRHILRQDPDIIMVGEIRDKETASLVTHAALTGHIVLSTLHTSNSLGVIPRLVDLGVQPFLIPPTLILAIAQRLVRRLCNECKKKVKPLKKIEDLILKEIEGFPPTIKKGIDLSKPLFVWEPKGCPHCNNKGFSGRVGLFEILEMTHQLAEIVLEDISEKTIQQEAERQLMTTMRQNGILKVLNGMTTIAEVLRVT
ncbi:MAG: GspE/PulE family protein [Candidatus Nealsonbacteria bacterium]